MIQKNPTQVPKQMIDNLGSYLNKSKDDKEVLLNFGVSKREIWTFDDSWIDFMVMGKTFLVISININNNNKQINNNDYTINSLYKLYKYAKYTRGCNKIIFHTFRNYKSFCKLIEKVIKKYSKDNKESVAKIKTSYEIEVKI